MSDIVNNHFREFYPSDHAINWEPNHLPGGSWGRRYAGDRAKWSLIFPHMVCADGLTLSVQGHFGAYSYPRDDFAEEGYSQVEIMGPRGLDDEFGVRGHGCGDECIYAYVPVQRVVALIEKHGGLVEAE